jgi:hypothetical protein
VPRQGKLAFRSWMKDRMLQRCAPPKGPTLSLDQTGAR